MDRTLRWEITESDLGDTVEQFLRKKGCSRHVITHLKKTECGITKNGIWTYANQKLNAGDVIEIHCIESETSSGILPVQLPLNIVYEDEDLLVIDKQSDMPIHPSINNYENTLANALMFYYSSQKLSFVYRCINRLDRDTSGLLIIAKNMISGAILSEMSARREIHRQYLAVVEGMLPEYGTIDAPIARASDSAIERCVDPDTGERAITHFRRLKYDSTACPDGLSLASVRLETGRTHQIRVHMRHIGHPLIGDFLYNPDYNGPVKRQALHSHTLEFQHPLTKKTMFFTSPLPADISI